MRAVLLCVALRCAVPADPAVVLFEKLGLQSSVASVAALLCVHPLLLSPPTDFARLRCRLAQLLPNRATRSLASAHMR